MSMPPRLNSLGLPVGEPLPAGWTGAKEPPRTPMRGKRAIIEPLDPERHVDDLHRAFAEDREGRIWTYLPTGPFAKVADLRAELEASYLDPSRIAHAILDRESGRAQGVASYLNIRPQDGSIEVGWICLAPALQSTATATEAMFLLARRVFDELGYRRYEWKCDALNARSRRAAERLGFTFEGIFRQATVYRGRNRDTAWYAMIDREWPAIRAAYERWLVPENFDPHGRQRQSLSRLVRNGLADHYSPAKDSGSA